MLTDRINSVNNDSMLKVDILSFPIRVVQNFYPVTGTVLVPFGLHHMHRQTDQFAFPFSVNLLPVFFFISIRFLHFLKKNNN